MEINTSYQRGIKTPEFSPSEISSLRCRLGQSRADFARSFGVELDAVFAWENGSLKPTATQRSFMVRLGQHADEYSDKTALRPALECALKDRNVEQIHSEELTILENETSNRGS